jgi:flavodoxin
MKIGIIYYSITGNTRSVAQKLRDDLIEQNNSVDLLEIQVEQNDPHPTIIEFIKQPKTTGFELLVFASPVHGFQPSAVIKAYLSALEDLKHKDVVLFVTHHFPMAWMGGTGSLKQMKKIVETRNGHVTRMHSINWSSKHREANIQALLEGFRS